MKRFFDLILASFLLVVLLLPMALISISIVISSKGPAIFWSDRIGKLNVVFKMPKFRSMRIDSPALPTHLMTDLSSFLSPIGAFLRRTSLDELPQLFSILKGDMSFVGPRPALYNQDDLIELRTQNNVHNLIPGLTGWAQINGRDELSIQDKVKMDIEYMHNQTFLFDLKIIFLTFLKVFKQENISS